MKISWTTRQAYEGELEIQVDDRPESVLQGLNSGNYDITAEGVIVSKISGRTIGVIHSQSEVCWSDWNGPREFEIEGVREPKIEVLVPRREGLDFSLVAHVTCSPTEAVTDAETLLKAIHKAVTQWVLSSDDGKRAWVCCVGNFGMAELDCYQNDAGLVEQLQLQGVFNLHITCYDADKSYYPWSFDTELADTDVIEAARK